MRIAIPLSSDTTTLAEHFSRASLFALYDIDNDTRSVKYLGRQSTSEPGCSRSPSFLSGHQVEVIMAHQLSPNAHAHLLESGIVAIQDAPLLSPDSLIAHLVSGSLQATPPAAFNEEGCSPGGCGHCPSGHTQTPSAETTACHSHTGCHSCSNESTAPAAAGECPSP